MLHLRSSVRAGFAAVVVATLGGVAAVEASMTASIDRFVIVRNDPPSPTLGLFYDDQFTNGLPPVSFVAEPAGGGAYGNGTPGTYALTGAFPGGAESGGRLQLDTTAGGFVTSANGVEFLRLGATLLSDTTVGSAAGLKPLHDFSVRARFDAVTPLANLDGYGLELTDSSPAGIGDDRLQFMVRRTGTGAAVVQLIDQRFAPGGGTTFLADTPYAPPAQTTQLSMFLDHLASNVGIVRASFYYVNALGNVYDPVGQMWTMVPASDSVAAAQYRTYLGANGQIFDDNEGYVRSGFFAVQAVPEPGTYAMLLAGLGILGWVARRRMMR